VGDSLSHAASFLLVADLYSLLPSRWFVLFFSLLDFYLSQLAAHSLHAKHYSMHAIRYFPNSLLKFVAR